MNLNTSPVIIADPCECRGPDIRRGPGDYQWVAAVCKYLRLAKLARLSVLPMAQVSLPPPINKTFWVKKPTKVSIINLGIILHVWNITAVGINFPQKIHVFLAVKSWDDINLCTFLQGSPHPATKRLHHRFTKIENAWNNAILCQSNKFRNEDLTGQSIKY